MTAAGVGGMVGGQYLDVAGDEAVELRHLHELKTGALIAASVGSVLALGGDGWTCHNPVPALCGRARRRLPDRRRHPRRDGDEAETGKPQGSDERHGEATYVSVHGLERAASSPGSRTRRHRRRSPRLRRDAAPGRYRRLHPDPHDMTKLLDNIDGPADLKGLHGRAAAGGRSGGPRADHRHDRRDRRSLRREPGRLRDRGRAALAARLTARQGAVGRRPPGLPAQGADRPPRPARHDPQVRGASPLLRDPRVGARHHGRRPRLDLGLICASGSRRRCAAGSARTARSSPSSATARSPAASPSRRS